jgi:hypothetical protein
MAQVFTAILLPELEDVLLGSIRYFPELLCPYRKFKILTFSKVYVVNATGVDDVRAALRFAKEKNISLVIKNTGHSYLGR